MGQPLYIQQFIRTCPSVVGVPDVWPVDSAMELWITLASEFWESLGEAPETTEEILAFCRKCASPAAAHPAVRDGADFAFVEHLFDHPKAFPALARHLTVDDLDRFAERLIVWNGPRKYKARRKKLEQMIEAVQGADR